MALKAACLQVWPFLFSEGDSPRDMMNRWRSHLVNQQHKDLQTKLILLTLEQPELHWKGLQKHHWGSFRKSFCLVQHKQEDSSLFSCVIDMVLKEAKSSVVSCRIPTSLYPISNMITSAFPPMLPSYHLQNCFCLPGQEPVTVAKQGKYLLELCAAFHAAKVLIHVPLLCQARNKKVGTSLSSRPTLPC